MKLKNNYHGFKGFLKLISTIISWTLLVLLVIIAFFLLYYTIGNKLAEQRHEKFEPLIALYTIISPSMTPNINVGDVVVTRNISKPEDIKEGDIITFISTASISKGMTITHRVVNVNKNGDETTYTTQGDNNLSPDSAPAQFDNVIGKVIFKVPQLGRVQGFIANQAGWLLLVVIPAVFIIVLDILKIFKLMGVKNKVEKIEQAEKLSKKIRKEREEKRKKEIKERLYLGKNEYEPDPIKIQKNIRIIVAEDESNNNKK